MGGAGCGAYENSLPSSPFFCKSNTILKLSLFLRIGASSQVLYFQNSPHKCSLFPNYSCLHQGYVNAHSNIGTTLPPGPQAPTQSTQSFQHPHCDGSHVFRLDSSPQHGIQGLFTSLTPILPLTVYWTFLKKLSLQLPLTLLYLLIPHLGCFSPLFTLADSSLSFENQLIHYFLQKAFFDPRMAMLALVNSNPPYTEIDPVLKGSRHSALTPVFLVPIFTKRLFNEE